MYYTKRYNTNLFIILNRFIFKQKIMEAPFVFGRIASAENFTDRDKETLRLVQNFSSSVNSIIISPRRWGKSSLVEHAARSVKRSNKEIRFCMIDLNNVRTEEQFYEYYATAVLKSSFNRTGELIDGAAKFLGRFIPNISFSPDPGSTFSLSMNWKEVMKSPDDIINLPQKIGADRKRKFVVCLDEFQNISAFGNPLDFQKKLRSHWQRHNMVSYCLYGSKRHMLMDVFASPGMPFYKFGDIIFLEKITADDWIPFLRKRFSATGKKIGAEESRFITELTDCHPYYVQQLAHQAWFRTESICSSEIIKMAFDDLVMQMSMLFQSMTDNLSNTQVNFLKAMLSGVQQFSSHDTVIKYGLGTPGNIIKIRSALVSREIIDMVEGKPRFLDPLFKNWLSKNYFN